MIEEFYDEKKKLRQILKDVLPKELDTDVNLERWLKNYDVDIHLCADKFRDYLETKKAYGLDYEALEIYPKNEEFINFVEIFGLSTFHDYWINELDNGLVFMETALLEPSKAPHVIRASDYSRLIFSYAEYVQHLVLKHEKKSGKESHGICIFDMQNLNILDYVNPYNPINKLFRSRVQIWFDCFGEILKHAIIINPPRFLGALLRVRDQKMNASKEVMSIILPAKLLERFIFIHDDPYDILPYLSCNAIPTFCGGEKEVSVVTTSRKIDKDEYLFNGEIWEENKIFNIPCEEEYISAGDVYEKLFFIEAGQKLLYEYFTNRDYEIYCTHTALGTLIPKLKLSTPTLSEEGSFTFQESGEFKLTIKNISKIMRMKLKIALLVI